MSIQSGTSHYTGRTTECAFDCVEHRSSPQASSRPSLAHYTIRHTAALLSDSSPSSPIAHIHHATQPPTAGSDTSFLAAHESALSMPSPTSPLTLSALLLACCPSLLQSLTEWIFRVRKRRSCTTGTRSLPSRLHSPTTLTSRPSLSTMGRHSPPDCRTTDTYSPVLSKMSSLATPARQDSTSNAASDGTGQRTRYTPHIRRVD